MASLNTTFNALCIYCYKSATQNNQSGNPSEIHQRFLKLINRHLNLNSKCIELLGECSPVPCKDCLGLLNNFCELYHQLKCLELQLNWQVDKLWNMMRWADRVPSRIKEFRKSQDFQNKFEFRKILKDKCKERFGQQSPRVSLSQQLSKLPKIALGKALVRDQPNVSSKFEFAEISIGNEINSNDDTDDYQEPQPQQSPCNLLININDFESDLSTTSNDVSSTKVQGEKESSSETLMTATALTSLPVINQNTGFSYIETDLTSQYENVQEQTFIRIKSESRISCSSKESAILPVTPPTKSHTAPNIEIDVKLVSLLPSQHSINPVVSASSSSSLIKKRVLEHQEKRPVLTRRSLRTKFQCSNCKRTFSDGKRLEAHNMFCSQSSETESDTTNTEEEDNIDVKVKSETEKCSIKEPTNCGNINDNDSNSKLLLDTTSSSSSHESDDEFVKKKSFQGKLYTCNKCIPPKSYNSIMHDVYKHSQGRLRLNAQNVERLHVTLNSLNLEGLSLESRYQCTVDPDNCIRKFPLSKELENHTKLHGKFTCPICDLCFTKTLDLIKHELQHSDEKQFAQNKSFQKGEIFHCARCDYKTTLNTDIISHYLKDHFGLQEIEAKCPICQQAFPNFDTVPLTHYINYHDLNRLDDPEQRVKCSERDCHAYFLIEDQLHVHWNREHCSLKAKRFQEKRDLRRKTYNYKRKLKNKHISCTYCSKKFHYQTSLRAHILAQHVKDAGFQDAEVTKGQRVITKDGLTVDDIVFEKNAKYICKIKNCKDKFRNEEDFQSHSKLHGEFPCSFCEIVSTSAMNLAIHETKHVENVNEVEIRGKPFRIKFRCSRCPFVTGWKEKYLDHFISQHLELTMDKKKCPICKHAFSIYCGVSTKLNHEFRKRLYRHCIEWHDFTGVEGGENEAFKCDKCSAYFRTNLQLIQHTEGIHDLHGQNNICEDCGRNFTTNKSFRNHRLKVHKVELKFCCNVLDCDKKFETLKELLYHKNYFHHGVTTGENTFGCEDCGKKFFTKIALLSHVKIHQKTNHGCVCEQCGKSFRDKQGLEVHYKFHEGPDSWDFTCEMCGKKIFSQQKLTEHMRVHTKEKPFVCQVCGVAYGHRHNLRIHVNSKHKEIKDVARKCTTTNFASSRKGKKLRRDGVS